MAKPYTYGEDNQERTRRVLEILLTYNDEEIDQGKIKCLKTAKGINFEISKQDLIDLITATHKSSDWDNDIRPVISHYLGWLGILQDNRTVTRGSSMWKFSLNLWCDNTTENLKRFNEEWTNKSPDRQKKSVREDSQPKQSQIDWLDQSRQLLEAQKHPTTNNFFGENKRNLDDIHVPLALVERKERPNVKKEPLPEHGSQLCQPEYTEVDRFEHDKFLARVVEKPAGVKHIAIIGEPGAGKTTILTKIGERLIQQAKQQPEEPLVVAWISLASLSAEQKLSEYFYGSWLDSAHPAACPPPSWKGELIKLVEQKRVWLLLDGLDETSKSDSLNWLNGQLAGWGQNLRVVVTCRLNQWEAAAGGNALTNIFDVYRTLDYSYQTSQGDDQVKEFICKWFADHQKVATPIRTELDAPGKERIKDLVKNPLRLTLLCASWERGNQALPETQAGLYEKFVDYLYGWKADKFPKEVELREELNLALGKLAKEGLNRQPNSDGAVRRFRFTTSEIRGLWGKQSKELLAAAKNLGWLNMVDKDTYSFYHPTFQEYFVACSIPDWDYFLPRDHGDKPVIHQGGDGTYRVFEAQWRQPILLWIGREDIDGGVKEKFVEKLMNFEDGVGDKFYNYRAYCIAAICVGEFSDSCWAEEIVDQIIRWAFYYFIEGDQCITSIEPLNLLAKGIIPFTHRRLSIAALIELLKDSQLDDNLHIKTRNHIRDRHRLLDNPLLKNSPHSNAANIFNHVATEITDILGKIAVKNEQTIATLIELINNSQMTHSIRSNAVEVLGKIAIGDKKAIAALIKLPNNSQLDDRLRFDAVKVLGKIAIGDKKAIAAVIELLKNDPLLDRSRPSFVIRNIVKIVAGDKKAIVAIIELLNNTKLDDSLRSNAVEALGEVGVGNKQAILALIKFLDDPLLDDDRRSHAAVALGKIAVGNKKAIAIAALIELLLKEFRLGNSQRNRDEDRAVRHFNRSGSYAYALGEIASGDEKAIVALIEVLKSPILYDYDDNSHLHALAAQSLGKIAVGDEKAIAVLIKLLKNSQLDGDLHSLVEVALAKIAIGDEKAIVALIEILLEEPLFSLFDQTRCRAADTLIKIAIGDKKAVAIAALIELLDNIRHEDYRDYLPSHLAEVIGKIAVGDEKAIATATLIEILEKSQLSTYRHTKAAEALGKIAVGDEKAIAIAALIEILLKEPPSESDLFLYNAVEALGELAVGNEQAILALIEVLKKSQLDNYVRFKVANALNKTFTLNTMPLAVWQLKNYTTDNIYNSNIEQYQSSFKVLFHCAQTLPYPDFYTAWHPLLPTIPFDPSTLHQKLNRPHTSILDLSNFPTTDIAIELTTRIYLELDKDIPNSDTTAKLKQELIRLNLTPHLVIICYHPQPPTALTRSISELRCPQRIQTIWLTEDNSIEGALPPEQPNLVAAIEAAIDRVAED